MIVLNNKFEIFKNIFDFMHSLNSSAKREARSTRNSVAGFYDVFFAG